MSATSPSENDRVTAAVITGGHHYDVVEFRRLFRELEGVDAYVQHIEDFASGNADERARYDVIVLYCMPGGVPSAEPAAHPQRTPLAAWEGLGATSQGIVMLHHGMFAYPEWPTWKAIAGIVKKRFTYHPNETLRVDVADPEHPISHGLRSWEMVDELYEMNEPEDDRRVILSTDHPRSVRSIAWTGSYRNARVFTFVSGHDSRTWQNTGFRTVLRRGIAWAAPRAYCERPG